MTKKNQRVRFYLPARYFTTQRFPSTGMWRDTCQRILEMAFDLCVDDSEYLMDHNPEGFWIICRPDQFAAFIVRCYEANACINRIADLRPRIFTGVDHYDRLARQFCVSRDVVVGLSQALGYEYDNGADNHVVKVKVVVRYVADSVDVSTGHGVRID